MARAQTAKLYRTFGKGLVTEAGFLTYPENASTDELNTVPSPRGSRNRRLGLDQEPGGIVNTLPGTANNTDADVTAEFTWRAADNNFTSNFLVQQVGPVVYFYAINDEPLSTHMKSYTVNLPDYATGNIPVETSRVQFASGKGYLFIVSEAIDPILVDYDPVADAISVLRVIVQVRDFDGVPDGLSNDNEPSTLSIQHAYNLKNQGWIAPGST